ncbi:hypothetical protein [Streptomyces hokutonensis]|uniref:hypothetical protein n=1 Tax=Streptomyces hokutonensis TaxID=1306990 RepID=UPI0033E97D9B
MGTKRVLGAGVLVAAAAMMSTAGCSAGSGGSTSSRATPRATVAFDASDPATWVLPIEGYLPSDNERKQVSQARKTLAADCMKKYGLSWRPAPDLPRLGPKTLVDWRYGIHDMALARERGYKPPAAEQEAYDRAVEVGAVGDTSGTGPETEVLEGGVEQIGGKAVPKGGCLGETDRKLSAGAGGTPVAQKLSTGTFVESQQDPAVVKAFKAWSDCMRAGGFTYDRPLDASDDQRFASQEVTPLEIKTATADISCRDRTNVARIWYGAETALQEKQIDSQAELLDRERRDLDSAVKKAASVVEGTR